MLTRFQLLDYGICTDQLYSADSIQAMIAKLAQSGLNFIQIGGTVVLDPNYCILFLLDWDRMLDSFRRLIPKATKDRLSHC